jgi:ATP-dependent protease ClpP protease subunit
MSANKAENSAEVHDAVEMIKTESFSDMMPQTDRIPRGIEVDENRIYFYCQVGQNEALELNRLIRKLDVEMKYLSDRLSCPKVPIHIHINSPGGDAFSGLSIVDTIKSCRTPIYTYVDGSAASAATLIAIAGDKKYASENSFMLFHQPSIIWGGKLDEFMDEVENQKNIYGKIKKIYLENSDISEEDLDELLQHELWLDVETCMQHGFIDKVY